MLTSWREKFLFLINAMRDFRHAASILPSSSASARAIAQQIAPETQRVVEFGPGTGVVTREILKKLPADGSLIAIEINKNFINELQKIDDPRLKIIAGDVLEVSQALAAIYPHDVDAIVSGIPFSLLTKPQRELILKNVKTCLQRGGRFITYQVSKLLLTSLQRYFTSVIYHWRTKNIPPYYIIVAN